MDVGYVGQWTASLPSREQLYTGGARLLNTIALIVFEALEWVRYFAMRSFCCTLYPNMTQSHWNQRDVFTRSKMSPPGLRACTFIAMAAVDKFVNQRNPFCPADLNSIVQCGVVAALRFAGAQLPNRLSRNELQRRINALPENIGHLKGLCSPDQAASQFKTLEDLFCTCSKNDIEIKQGLEGFFDIAHKMKQKKVAAVIALQDRGSHMLGVKKGDNGAIEEVVFFDSHGTWRSQGRAFSLSWTAVKDGDPKKAFEEFIGSLYGREVGKLGFTPYALPLTSSLS